MLLQLSSEEEKILSSVLSRHFNLHPFFCGYSLDKLFSMALQEITGLYNSERHEALYLYLLSCWYGADGEFFKQWGRHTEQYVSFARTTMFVEGHWSALKRNYLIYHNRPRLDFLLYIIDVKLVPKFSAVFDLIRYGKVVPAWYKALRKEWNKKEGVRTAEFRIALTLSDGSALVPRFT